MNEKKYTASELLTGIETFNIKSIPMLKLVFVISELGIATASDVRRYLNTDDKKIHERLVVLESKKLLVKRLAPDKNNSSKRLVNHYKLSYAAKEFIEYFKNI